MQSTTLKRALTRWLVLQRIGKKPSTRHYHWELIKTLRRLLRSRLCVPVSDVSEADVTDFALSAAHYSASRWNGLVGVLRATVPAASVLKRRKVPLKEKRMPSQKEFSTLLAECDRLKKSKAGLVINFLAHTGMRITEARLLLWSDVFPDRIEVRGEIAKSGKPRIIPNVNGLGFVLDRLRAVAGDSGYVLPRKGIKRGLALACARAGLQNLTHHDFRHLFTTRCVESGVDIPTLARWLGHQDKGALLSKRYFHLSDEHSRRMAERVRI